MTALVSRKWFAGMNIQRKFILAALIICVCLLAAAGFRFDSFSLGAMLPLFGAACNSEFLANHTLQDLFFVLQLLLLVFFGVFAWVRKSRVSTAVFCFLLFGLIVAGWLGAEAFDRNFHININITPPKLF